MCRRRDWSFLFGMIFAFKDHITSHISTLKPISMCGSLADLKFENKESIIINIVHIETSRKARNYLICFLKDFSSLHSKHEYTSLSKTHTFWGSLRHSRKGARAYIAFGRGLHIQSCRRVRDESGETPQEPGVSEKKAKNLTEQANMV